MTQEAFLVNPMKPTKRRKTKRAVRKNPIGAGVLMLGNPWYDDARGHKKAATKGWRRRKRKPTKRRRKRGILAAAPKRRYTKRATKRATPMKRQRKYTKRLRPSSPVLYTGGTPFRHNPVRRTRKRRMYRNPVLSVRSLSKSVKEVLPLAVTGGASIVATKIVPTMVGVLQPWKILGVQAAVAFGGGIVVSKVVNPRHGLIWTVSGAATVVADLLQRYVLTKVLPGVAGMGAYPNYDLGAYPDAVNEDYGVSPYETSVETFEY